MSKDSLLEPPSSKKQQQPAGSNKTNKNGVPEFKQKVTKLDVKIDNQVKYEFGCYSHDARLSMPDVLLLGVCVEFHQGRLIYPSDLSQWKSWVAHEIWDKIKMGAYPSKWATQMYMGYVLFSFVLAYIMPGPVVEELPIPSLNGKKARIYTELRAREESVIQNI
jgi:delta24(24(1))-sterol reductase